MHTTFSLTTSKVSSMTELTCRVVSEDATHRTGRLRVLPAADGPRSIIDRTRAGELFASRKSTRTWRSAGPGRKVWVLERLQLVMGAGRWIWQDKEVVSRTEVGRGYSNSCLLYTSPSPRDLSTSRMPSSA